MTRMKEETAFREYNCPILGDVALVTIKRRLFTADEMDEPMYGPATLGGCENVHDCGAVAKSLPGGGFRYDWPKCAAYQTMNSSGRA